MRCRLLFGSVVVAAYQCVADVATTAWEVYGSGRESDDPTVRNGKGNNCEFGYKWLYQEMKMDLAGGRPTAKTTSCTK